MATEDEIDFDTFMEDVAAIPPSQAAATYAYTRAGISTAARPARSSSNPLDAAAAAVGGNDDDDEDGGDDEDPESDQPPALESTRCSSGRFGFARLMRSSQANDSDRDPDDDRPLSSFLRYSHRHGYTNVEPGLTQLSQQPPQFHQQWQQLPDHSSYDSGQNAVRQPFAVPGERSRRYPDPMEDENEEMEEKNDWPHEHQRRSSPPQPQQSSVLSIMSESDIIIEDSDHEQQQVPISAPVTVSPPKPSAKQPHTTPTPPVATSAAIATGASSSAPPPPQSDLTLDLTQFLEQCPRCRKALTHDLYMARCGHVYHGRCCIDWRGCVLCEDVIYLDRLPRVEPSPPPAPTVAAAAASSSSTSAVAHAEINEDLSILDEDYLGPSSLLLANLGNRRRRSDRNRRLVVASEMRDSTVPIPQQPLDPNAPAIVTAKGLTKLYFEPQAVIESMFPSASNVSEGGSEPCLTQEQSEIANMTIQQRTDLVNERLAALAELENNKRNLEKDCLTYESLLTQSCLDRAKYQKKVDKYSSRLKEANKQEKSNQTTIRGYERDLRGGDMLVTAIIKQLIRLDKQDQESEARYFKEKNEPKESTSQLPTLPFQLPSTLPPAHHYLHIPESDFWKDLLLIDPNLLRAIAQTQSQQSKTNKASNGLSLHSSTTSSATAATTTDAASSIASLTGQPVVMIDDVFGLPIDLSQPFESHIDLLSLGLANLPSLGSKSTVTNITKLLQSDPDLKRMVDTLPLKPPPPSQPFPSEAHALDQRNAANTSQRQYCKQLNSFMDGYHLNKNNSDTTRMPLEERLKRNQENLKLHRDDLERKKKAIKHLEEWLEANPANATVSGDAIDESPRKKSKISCKPTTASSTPIPMDISEDEHSDTVKNDSTLMNMDQDQVIKNETATAAPPEPLKFSSTNAPSSARLPPSSTYFPQPMINNSNQSRLAAAMEMVERISSHVAPQVKLSNITTIAANEVVRPPPPPKANPFGIKPNHSGPSSLSTSASISAAVSANRLRSKSSQVGGDLIVTGHDGKGGKVSILRSVQQLKQSKPSTPTTPQQSSPSPSAQPSSSFGVDSSAFRRMINTGQSMNNQFDRPVSSSRLAQPSALVRALNERSQQQRHSDAGENIKPSRSLSVRVDSGPPPRSGLSHIFSQSRPSSRPPPSSSSPSPILIENGHEVVVLIDDAEEPPPPHPFFARNTSVPSTLKRTNSARTPLSIIASNLR